MTDGQTEQQQLAMHPLAEPLRLLLGTWRGAGEGSYPTIDDFSYNEEITFGHVGKPFLAYGQKTKNAGTGMPLHAESGYFRSLGEGAIELVMAHPTGILESLEGHCTDDDGALVLDLRTRQITGTATAVDVAEVTRRIEVAGDVLRYEVSMAAAGQPLTHHLAATLHRA